MKKYQIPSNIKKKKPKWVHDHYNYLNKMIQDNDPERFLCNSEMTKLCRKYKEYTDKSPDASYWIKHNYTEIYDFIFRFYKNKKINFLEIGVRQGGSLMLWNDYFVNPMRKIFGYDKSTSAILRGSLVDKKGQKVISYGEIIKTSTLRILSDKFMIKKPLTILRVSKIK